MQARVGRKRATGWQYAILVVAAVLGGWWYISTQTRIVLERNEQLEQLALQLKAHHDKQQVAKVAAETTPPPDLSTRLEYYSDSECLKLVDSSLLSHSAMKQSFLVPEESIKSIKLTSKLGFAELFLNDRYEAAVFALDGCVRVFNAKPTSVILYATCPLMQNRQVSLSQLDSMRFELLRREPSTDAATYRVVFSSESSEYFGYQTFANRLAFAQSQKHFDATWTREEVILVIDPDSWLLKPVYDKFITRVKPGFALGQQTYYTGSRTAQKLWKELCEHNCEREMDLVGVPYVIHRDDLGKLAPLWKYYVLKIKYLLESSNPNREQFHNTYGKLDVDWASEMFGYNMAAAHLGIAHEIVSELQVRDVDGERTDEACKDKVSLHAGRAWFPRGHAMAKPYLHTEGKSLRMYGDQVWCKCNFTASTVKPWPIPQSGVDFVSKHTLRLLHESDEKYGPVPNNQKFRRNIHLENDYGWTKK
ncbi:hypothetical protein BASA81_011008 [Batrachochytrium salamandrivorans]|nr:hypothetical protein BASA81_011008 [Batrachochytrium salamandrivorans]